MPLINNPPVGSGPHGEWHHAERTVINVINDRLLSVELADGGMYNTVTAPDNPADNASEDIQLAIDLALPTGGGVGQVVLKSGTFRLAEGLNIPRENIYLHGMGVGINLGVTTLKPDAGITAITVSNAVTYPNVYLSDFCIWGGARGIHLPAGAFPAVWCSFERLNLRDQTDTAMLIEADAITTYFKQVRFHSGINGLVISPTSFNNVSQFEMVYFSGLEVGLSANEMLFGNLNSCLWQANDAAIILQNCDKLQFHNSYFEHNGDPVADVHTPDVQIGSVGPSAKCYNLSFYDTYSGPHNVQPGGAAHVWLQVKADGEAPGLGVIRHDDYGNSIDWGDGRITTSTGLWSYDGANQVVMGPDNYLYMYDTVTGARRQLSIANGNLVIT